MASAQAKMVPPVPVKPTLESVTLVLSAQEARDLSAVLGETVGHGAVCESITAIHAALWDADESLESYKVMHDKRYAKTHIRVTINEED